MLDVSGRTAAIDRVCGSRCGKSEIEGLRRAALPQEGVCTESYVLSESEFVNNGEQLIGH